MVRVPGDRQFESDVPEDPAELRTQENVARLWTIRLCRRAQDFIQAVGRSIQVPGPSPRVFDLCEQAGGPQKRAEKGGHQEAAPGDRRRAKRGALTRIISRLPAAGSTIHACGPPPKKEAGTP